ncbi:IS1096 element passenger TnpR family protein [Xenorhabdus anantnagensis]|uniref:Plasmid pRiA4b Orf3-like domain-containing protein n=1 Tax=Xenorhabdus anantnagensis TaxID=3025875 RepID=A0ABT5LUQ2_9GAMM|nr:hypothetical protein [Xenorhabdus anantnagensis]
MDKNRPTFLTTHQLKISCLDGQQACPPEDSGGTYGYIDLINIINDPSHEDYLEMFKWINGKSDVSPDKIFSPEKFNMLPSNVIFIDGISRVYAALTSAQGD